MTTPRYLPVATFKAWHKDETSIDDTLVEQAINAAEMSIDSALKRRIALAGDTATARVYRPVTDATTLLRIDDAVDVTSVVEDGDTLVVTTDYQLEPLNGLAASGESRPYDMIRRVRKTWAWDEDLATVTVTARWGWASIPPLVVEACKIVAADMLSNRDMRNGLVAISEAGGVGSRENRTVREMISRYSSNKSPKVA